MSRARLAEFLPRLQAELAARGLDLVAWVPVGRYSQEVPPEYALPDLGDPANPCVVVGNTRALWDALASSPTYADGLEWHFLPPEEYGHPGLPPVEPFDPTEARRLVREVTGGGRVRLRCFTDRAFGLLGRAMAAQLSKVGIDLEVRPVSKHEIRPGESSAPR